MKGTGGASTGAAALILLLLAATAGLAQSGAGLTALAQLRPGLWQLRDLDRRGSRPQSICVRDANILMQIQHRNSPCSRIVISNAADEATVHYTCPSNGFGRTSIRVETPRLVQVDTQGISAGVPFAYRLEARRTGACPASNNKAGR